MSFLDNLSISRKQIHLINHGNKTAPGINLATGSVRAGKTVGLNFSFLMQMAEDPPGDGEDAIFGRTRETIYRNILSPMMKVGMYGELVNHIKYNPGAPTASIFGKPVHIIGTSDSRSEQVVRGLTLRRSITDELTLLSEDTFNMIVSRHTAPESWIGATTNPDGPQHWVKKQVIDQAEYLGHYVQQFSIYDNEAHLPPGFIANMQRQYTGLWARRFLGGEWAIAEGAVYEQWDTARHVVAHSAMPEMRRMLAFAVDYGDTHATAGILLGLGEDGRLYAVDEWAPGKGSPQQRVAWLKEWLEKGDYEPEYLFVDPAAAPFKQQLLYDGMPGYNALNEHSAVLLVASLLSTGNLLISDRCTNLIEEFPAYIWDPKKQAQGKDEPVKENDDFLDALRYVVNSSQPSWRPYLPTLREVTTRPTPYLESFADAAA